MGSPVQTLNSTVTVCSFSGAKAGRLIVRFQTGFAINTLVARQGSVEILVTSKASLGGEEALERQLFAKL